MSIYPMYSQMTSGTDNEDDLKSNSELPAH